MKNRLLRSVILLTAAALIAAALLPLFACVSIAPVDGSYNVFTINRITPDVYFESLNAEDPSERPSALLTVPEDYDGEPENIVTLKLKSGGTAEVTVFGKAKTGTWTAKDDDVLITFEDGETMAIERLRSTAMLLYVLDGVDIILHRAR
ncbi:MAG: hypothetical protein IK064_06565 [Clostridia bacterium]|nr:hypothetical protein [Clostridia bacterium]